VYFFQVICIFPVINYGALSISAATGSLKSQVTSPFDSPATISYSSVQYTLLV
jgi:hypothetical protein